MKIKNNLITIIILISLISLVSCQKNNKLTELEKQMQLTKEKIESQQPKKISLYLPPATPVIYQSEKWRDPFEPSQTRQGEVGTINSLTNLPLAMIRFIGIIVKNNIVWGIVLTPDNHTFKIKIGDVIGNLNGKITKIDARQIEVTETIIDDQNRRTQRLVILPIK